ncbi:ligase [Aureococcus anophagefferens]|nr:ligase [Aureococcus anophagefferens]
MARVVAALAALASRGGATHPWRHAEALDRELRNATKAAHLQQIDLGDVVDRELVGAVRVVHTLHARTRYFSLPQRALRRAPLGRRSAEGRLLGGGEPRVVVGEADDGVAHNFGVLLTDGGTLLGGGGLFRLAADERLNGSRGRDLYGDSLTLHGPNENYRGLEFFAAADRWTALRPTAAWAKVPGSTISGGHPGCVERRATFGGLCEFDGRVSLVERRGGEVLAYARANTNAAGGGRGVQVARAADLFGGSGWGPFELATFQGLDDPSRANVYFAAVARNPVDGASLLGLFPTVLPSGASFVALAFSCDGARFSALAPLLNGTRARGSAALDQPVSGVVRRGDTVFFYVHRDVPGIAKHTASRPWTRSRVVSLAASAAFWRRGRGARWAPGANFVAYSSRSAPRRWLFPGC